MEAARRPLERALRRERIQAGLRRARAQGKRLGRPPTVSHRDLVMPLRQAGKSIRAIARELGISRRAVQRALQGAHIPLPDLSAKGAIRQGFPSP